MSRATKRGHVVASSVSSDRVSLRSTRSQTQPKSKSRTSIRDLRTGTPDPRGRDRLDALPKKKRNTKPASLGTLTLPRLTPPLAYECAKLIMSGVPNETALAYCNPAYYLAAKEHADRDEMLRTWERAWFNDPLLVSSLSKFNGGEWQELEPERRLQIGLDKHMAELAFYLYSHSYDGLTGIEFQKATNARQALSEYLTAKGTDPDAPWVKAMKDIVEQFGDSVKVLTIPASTLSGDAKKGN